MKITAVSDLHGLLPDVQEGDLLIVGGDLTASDKYTQYNTFFNWLLEQDYEKKIIIGGNHDVLLQKGIVTPPEKIDYLMDSGTSYRGVKIWGMPWNLSFKHQNPECMAWSVSEEEIAKKVDLIPDDTDILITHSPPFGIMDRSMNTNRVGCYSLAKKIPMLKELKYHFFGHIHEEYGFKKVGDVCFFNCAQMTKSYNGDNEPWDLIVDDETLNLEE